MTIKHRGLWVTVGALGVTAFGTAAVADSIVINQDTSGTIPVETSVAPTATPVVSLTSFAALSGNAVTVAPVYTGQASVDAQQVNSVNTPNTVVSAKTVISAKTVVSAKSVVTPVSAKSVVTPVSAKTVVSAKSVVTPVSAKTVVSAKSVVTPVSAKTAVSAKSVVSVQSAPSAPSAA